MSQDLLSQLEARALREIQAAREASDFASSWDSDEEAAWAVIDIPFDLISGLSSIGTDGEGDAELIPGAERSRLLLRGMGAVYWAETKFEEISRGLRARRLRSSREAVLEGLRKGTWRTLPDGVDLFEFFRDTRRDIKEGYKRLWMCSERRPPKMPRTDSPIETKFVKALLSRELPEGCAETQKHIGPYRVDIALAGERARLVIECDGHDYHERTKVQAARDRSRDRALLARGWQVIRFTGSEINKDATGCADEAVKLFRQLEKARC